MCGRVEHIFICHGISQLTAEHRQQLSTGQKSVEFNLWSLINKVNVKSTLQIVSLCIPFLRQYQFGGSVTVLSSVAGENPWPNYEMFNESFAALNMMMKCAALENGHYGVRFNAVAALPQDIK